MPKIKSDFAILDVKQGRVALKKLFDANPKQRIPVTIVGHITDVWGGDDGISREFSVSVDQVSLGDPA